MGLGDNLLGFGGWDKGTWGLAKKHSSSIALVPFLELQAIQIWSYKRPNFGGTSDPSPLMALSKQDKWPLTIGLRDTLGKWRTWPHRRVSQKTSLHLEMCMSYCTKLNPTGKWWKMTGTWHDRFNVPIHSTSFNILSTCHVQAMCDKRIWCSGLEGKTLQALPRVCKTHTKWHQRSSAPGSGG